MNTALNINSKIPTKQLKNNSINATHLFFEARDNLGFEFVKNSINVHKGTIGRWVSQNKVPENYFNDLNYILGNKYNNKEEFRNKDQFYTTAKISKYCYNKTFEVLKALDIDSEKYNFIEPSAGCGNFYNLMPKDKRVGVDIDPKDNFLIKQNYLDFYPDKNNKYIVLGNPPFGLRGNLALRFLNHSAKFADIVAFILPPLFNSDGKGSPKKRVQGYELAHSENLPLNSFEYPNGKKVEVATVFQVWTKINKDKITIPKLQTCNDFIKVYSLSDGGTPSSTRNKKMLYKCDAYLPSTCFSDMHIYDEFEKLPHRRGYGIVFLQQEKKMRDLFFNKVDWEKASFLSTNSAMNLRKSIIEQEIVKSGFIDKGIFDE
jgi:hypothetical protein